MQNAILAAKQDGDSVGGVLETAVSGLPAGVGEPWFDTFEGLLSHILFSVPAIKGVEFGDGFALADMRGSEANDPYCFENGKVLTATNHNGGVTGGITNGMPVIFRCAVKPTPSIAKVQQTIDLASGENTTLSIKGRHDPAVLHRARVVVDAVTALCVADMLTGRYGTDYLANEV
jgi:chorismate synthase